MTLLQTLKKIRWGELIVHKQMMQMVVGWLLIWGRRLVTGALVFGCEPLLGPSSTPFSSSSVS